MSTGTPRRTETRIRRIAAGDEERRSSYRENFISIAPIRWLHAMLPVPCGAVEALPSEDDASDRNDAATMVASIHYVTRRQKDLAGAPRAFDVDQTRINDAT